MDVHPPKNGIDPYPVVNTSIENQGRKVLSFSHFSRHATWIPYDIHLQGAAFALLSCSQIHKFGSGIAYV